MQLSKRIQKIEESGIRKIFALAAERGNEFVNLSIGQPHFPAPAAVKQAAIAAVEANRSTYTPTAGLPTLRELIAGKLRNKNNIIAMAEQTLVTSGASASLLLAFSAIFDEGDEIILPDPYFVLYYELLQFLGVKIKLLDTYPTFQIDASKIAPLITDKTKAILVNSPNNPTGAVYTREVLEQIARVAKAHDLIVISDEIYEPFDYEHQFVSIASMYQNTVTINGFSKSHSITGWRLDYAHGPQEIISAMNRLQQYSFVCGPSIAQYAVMDAFDASIKDGVALYQKNRDYLFQELSQYYEFNKPAGAFYAFIKAPGGRVDFIDELIAHKLLAVPGSVFSSRSDYFRISFAVEPSILEQGVAILKSIAKT